MAATEPAGASPSPEKDVPKAAAASDTSREKAVSAAFPPLPALSENEFLHTSEAVTEGQIDRLCDVICDDILQASLQQDEHARVNLTALVKSRMVVVSGEVAIKGTLDYDLLVRKTLQNCGYDSEEKTGMDYRSANVVIAISEQSPDLASALSLYYGGGKSEEAIQIPNGDFGTGSGYATDESGADHFMPVSCKLANALASQLTVARKSGQLPWLKPNGKVQVTFVYRRDEKSGSLKPVRIYRIMVHNSGWDGKVSLPEMQLQIKQFVIDVVLGKRISAMESASTSTSSSSAANSGTTTATATGGAGGEGGEDSKAKVPLPELKETEFTFLVKKDVDVPILHVNYTTHKSNRTFIATNSDEYQGSGAAGQRTDSMSYGGWCSSTQGGRHASGKDPWKIERFAACAARWIAKSLVAAKLCHRCTVSLSYASNFAEPTAILFDFHHSLTSAGKQVEKKIIPVVQSNFDLRVGCLVKSLQLSSFFAGCPQLFPMVVSGASTIPVWEEPRALRV
ncbi:unnamed protein product [Amoebophrya sp. A120]|nr:unnamed protein product [Amoebophrya sp. A120]|eukprot:GSA120T00013267001.1